MNLLDLVTSHLSDGPIKTNLTIFADNFSLLDLSQSAKPVAHLLQTAFTCDDHDSLLHCTMQYAAKLRPLIGLELPTSIEEQASSPRLEDSPPESTTSGAWKGTGSPVSTSTGIAKSTPLSQPLTPKSHRSAGHSGGTHTYDTPVKIGNSNIRQFSTSHVQVSAKSYNEILKQEVSGLLWSIEPGLFLERFCISVEPSLERTTLGKMVELGNCSESTTFKAVGYSDKVYCPWFVNLANVALDILGTQVKPSAEPPRKWLVTNGRCMQGDIEKTRMRPDFVLTAAPTTHD